MIRIKDDFIVTKDIKKIYYLDNYNGFPDNNYLVIQYSFDDKDTYIKVEDFSDYLEQAEIIMNYINDEKEELS